VAAAAPSCPRDRELHAYGIARIYSPDDGRALGLQGMINDLLCDFDHPGATSPRRRRGASPPEARDPLALGRLITARENHPEQAGELRSAIVPLLDGRKVPVLGVTGTGGAASRR
jgi:methylmalonyl-CoA mutase